jgi:hypothetical protein
MNQFYYNQAQSTSSNKVQFSRQFNMFALPVITFVLAQMEPSGPGSGSPKYTEVGHIVCCFFKIEHSS